MWHGLIYYVVKVKVVIIIKVPFWHPHSGSSSSPAVLAGLEVDTRSLTAEGHEEPTPRHRGLCSWCIYH